MINDRKIVELNTKKQPLIVGQCSIKKISDPLIALFDGIIANNSTKVYCD